MSISGISSSTPTPIQPSAAVGITQAAPIKVNVPGATGTSGVASTASTAAQEATETPDVTRKEAAKGDKQAVKLLAKEAAAQSGPSGVNIKV